MTPAAATSKGAKMGAWQRAVSLAMVDEKQRSIKKNGVVGKRGFQTRHLVPSSAVC
jgi:hypothetical protein